MHFNGYPLKGIWDVGWAMDLHTLYSRYWESDDEFETRRTELGQALYLMKYKNNYEKFPDVVDWVSQFIIDKKLCVVADVMLPVPASRNRLRQPVYVIARRVGAQLDLPIDDKYLMKVKETPPLKNIDNIEERKVLLKNAFDIPDTRYEGKNVLLFDDLFRSGTTLTEITKLLREKGGVRKILVLTLTKTRSKK